MFGTQTGSITAGFFSSFIVVYHLLALPVTQCCRSQVQGQLLMKLPYISKNMKTKPSHMITEVADVGSEVYAKMNMSINELS